MKHYEKAIGGIKVKKVIIYGSHHWPECDELKEVLSEKGIKFAYFDISLDFGALKRFLKIRDIHPVFISVKEAGRVGIPAILVDDEVMLGLEDAKIDELMK